MTAFSGSTSWRVEQAKNARSPLAPAKRAAEPAGHSVLGRFGVAAPTAVSSSVSRYSRVARATCSGTARGPASTLVQRLASALMSAASTPNAYPPTRPSAMRDDRTPVSSRRNRPPSRKRPRRFFENVE